MADPQRNEPINPFASPKSAPHATRPSVRMHQNGWKEAFRDAGILVVIFFGTLFAAGFVERVGLLRDTSSLDAAAYLFALIGMTIAGARAPRDERWSHLFRIGTAAWLLQLAIMPLVSPMHVWPEWIANFAPILFGVVLSGSVVWMLGTDPQLHRRKDDVKLGDLEKPDEAEFRAPEESGADA